MEALRSSEQLVTIYKTIWCLKPEDKNPKIYCSKYVIPHRRHSTVDDLVNIEIAGDYFWVKFVLSVQPFSPVPICKGYW
jgi:hypothetical protein